MNKVETDKFIEYIALVIAQLNTHKKIAIECDVDDILIDFHNRMISHCEILQNLATEKELLVNYLNLFQNDINLALKNFPYRQQRNLEFLNQQDKLEVKRIIESQLESLEKKFKLVQFNLDFFKKLNFFNDNIVAIGANGSGKTTLSNDLKKYLPNTGVVISAQKVLIIPTFSGVSNFNNTNQKLQQSQSSDKSLKVTYSTENSGNSYHILTQLGAEFQILLDNLLAERSVKRNQFCDAIQSGEKEISVPLTKLDIALKIWNSLIQHRIIECNDGINITLRAINDSNNYPAHQMSDGEKVALYLISHVLQAPESGFIIIDEPEMYLHKTILKKLWTVLEQERKDCIFIYLTHDLDFATSRATAKKVWIKSFNHPDNWEIEDIPHNELPEPLLLELLGSRKNILFCEGEKGKLDEKIYNILFPDFTITPVNSCFAVINFTKAFNKLPNVMTKAIGIIDSDHHGVERLSALSSESIYSFSITEPENLFLDEEFLKLLATQLLIDDASIVDKIKADVILYLEKEIEIQSSNYVSNKINYYFNDSHVSKGNTLALVQDNYKNFTDDIKIPEWYEARKLELQYIINEKDYVKAISIFNNKGVQHIVNKHFKIKNFLDRAIKLLQFDSTTHNILRKHFPNEITNKC